MLNAAKLEAVGQLADRHVIGIDHAGQIFAWVRLEDLAHAEQSIQSMCSAAAVSAWTAATEPRPRGWSTSP